jgi:hypothetical protein
MTSTAAVPGAFKVIDCAHGIGPGSHPAISLKGSKEMNCITKRNLTAICAALLVGTAGPAAAAQAADRHIVLTGQHGGTTTATWMRGTDGAWDRTTTGPKGRVWRTDRTRNADGTANATTVGPNGGVTTVSRARNSAGAVDATITGAKGGTWRVDRSRGADGAIDVAITGPNGRVTTVDRSKN